MFEIMRDSETGVCDTIEVRGFIKQLEKVRAAIGVLVGHGLVDRATVQITPVETIHSEESGSIHEGTEYMLTLRAQADYFHQIAKIIGDHDDFQPAEVYAMPVPSVQSTPSTVTRIGN